MSKPADMGEAIDRAVSVKMFPGRPLRRLWQGFCRVGANSSLMRVRNRRGSTLEFFRPGTCHECHRHLGVWVEWDVNVRAHHP